jgi:hypothetical protein
VSHGDAAAEQPPSGIFATEDSALADPRPARQVTVYHADDCSLCARALEVVFELREEVDFELELVDIGGRPELEARYRERLPVIEVDGQPAFEYFVTSDGLRARLTAPH